MNSSQWLNYVRSVSIATLALLSAGQASAQQNMCGNYREPVGMIGVCGNRALPADKVRNVRNVHLECGSGADRYVRTFVPFDYDAWTDLEVEPDGRQKMQDFRLAEPAPAWKGSIPYETTEVWQWTDCVYGADPVCGYDRKCHDEERCTTGADGKQECHTEQVCVDVMRSCYHDEEQSEARFCSTERMDFHAAFAKPEKSWKPGAPGYYDIIPNKYDLLPGEIEVVQVFANSGRSTSVSPSVEIGDAWNKYDLANAVSIDGHGRAAECRYNQPLHATVNIRTIERIYGKDTPNAFRIPVDEEGTEVPPLEWSTTANSKGDQARYKPIKANLMDASHTMISAMADQSRADEAERERAKAEAGKSGNQTPEQYVREKNKAAKSKGFWKNTNVRVRLYETTGWASRDIRWTHNLFTNGAESSKQGNYRIELNGDSCKDDLYRASGPFSDKLWESESVELRPNKKYQLLVSMYQDGVPFYKQAKDKQSSSVYSKELQINFSTDKYMDKRGLKQKIRNWRGGW